MNRWTGSHGNNAPRQLSTLFIDHKEFSVVLFLKQKATANLPEAQWNYETLSAENINPNAKPSEVNGEVQLYTVIAILPPPFTSLWEGHIKWPQPAIT